MKFGLWSFFKGFTCFYRIFVLVLFFIRILIFITLIGCWKRILCVFAKSLLWSWCDLGPSIKNFLTRPSSCLAVSLTTHTQLCRGSRYTCSAYYTLYYYYYYYYYYV